MPRPAFTALLGRRRGRGRVAANPAQAWRFTRHRFHQQQAVAAKECAHFIGLRLQADQHLDIAARRRRGPVRPDRPKRQDGLRKKALVEPQLDFTSRIQRSEVAQAELTIDLLDDAGHVKATDRGLLTG